MSYTNGLDKPTDYFNTILYTGDGSASNRSLTGLDFLPDLVWNKSRSNAYNHYLFDSVRGAGQLIFPNDTSAEQDKSADFISFDSNGFTLKNNAGSLAINASSVTFANWCWKAGTTSGITTDGNTTITPSSYSFNQTSGFSILSFTGNGVDGAKLAHGLGTTPAMVIIKRYSTTGDWVVYHKGVTTGKNVFLNYNIAETDGGLTNGYIYSPDATNITLSNHADVNNSGVTTIAYCFAEKKGYSKFGSYTGNGNADGTFIYTGFKPAFVLFKRTSSTSNWSLFDNKRDTFNINNSYVQADTSAAEQEFSDIHVDFLSNGIKQRGTNISLNSSGDTFIFMAFAESPFVTSGGIPTPAR